MYLDHLRNNSIATAAAESSVSFMDCMEAALFCTEVHSAADAYLIKAEADYMATAAEDGEGAAKEGWWSKIKKVFQKMWDAIVAFGKKVVSFIKNTIKPKVTKIFKQIAVKWQALGMKGKLEKYKDATPDASKLGDVKFIDGVKAAEEFNKVIKTLRDHAPRSTEMQDDSEIKVQEIVDGLPSVSKKDASYMVAASSLKYSDITAMVNDITSGKSVKDILAVVNQAETICNDVTKYMGSAKENMKKAEKEGSEQLAKGAMNTLRKCRTFLTAASIISNHAGSCAVGVILSQAKAVNAWFSACNKGKSEEKKAEDKK